MALESLSIFSLITNADLLVQMVMLVLLAASIFSWSIVFDKLIMLKKQMKKADIFEQYFLSGKSIKDLYHNVKNNDCAFSRVFIASVKEHDFLHQSGKYKQKSIKEKMENVISLEQKSIINEFEHNIDWLATTGSTSPFIGLLGTVWGIMSSFQEIAIAKNTTLAIVAPGIAEALLATAVGLLVAIPAVIFYNRIVIKIEKFSHRLKDFSSHLIYLLTRDSDE
ncbi:MAG: protein TolQ [Rickettsiaceae bacterium H1]|nr:protein TolQ [Rickettsiaceae bacterium H1]